MNSQPSRPLLGADDPHPVMVLNPEGASSFLLLGDHAGNRVPQALEPFGVDANDLARHIGWDIGIGALGEALAAKLDATFVRQSYSRLVIDCNRDPAADDAVPAVSDGTPVPANMALGAADRAVRVAAIHMPYHAAIGQRLAERDTAGRETCVVSLHSFTPVMNGAARPWHIGLLYGGGDERFARAMLTVLQTRGDLIVGDNQPYAMDGVDYTVPYHAFAPRRAYVEIEIRQDLLATPAQIAGWVTILADVLRMSAQAHESGL